MKRRRALLRIAALLPGPGADGSMFTAAQTLLPSPQRLHTKARFAFSAHSPLEKVAPLFGARKERVWSPQWDPQFISPLPAADVQGMVFTVKHGELNSTWVNTEFDLQNGRVQYVYLIPDALVTVITIRLKPERNHTMVEVEYERTALTEQADAHVRHLAERDRAAGPEWESQINTYLAKQVDGPR